MSTALRLVRMLLDATRAGRIRWVRSSSHADLYEAMLGSETLSVKFIRFLRADKAHPDRHLAELTAFGVTTDHAVGTEGMEQIQQMLAICDPQLRSVRNAIRERINEAEDAMAAFLEHEMPASTPKVKQVKLPTRGRRTASRALRDR